MDRATILLFMRYSSVFPKTERNVPREIQSTSYRLLLQAGYVRPLGHGLIALTPLGVRVVERIKDLVRGELEALGAQEVMVPIVTPREIWEQSMRDELVGDDMIRFRDRVGRHLVLSPTHEEAMVEFFRSGLKGIRDLPTCFYEFQPKFRDEEKPRYGLLRSREFMMKDAYSFHRNFADLNTFLPRMARAYRRIFETVDVPAIMAEAGVGYMGGERSFEFLMPSAIGDDDLVRCNTCDYAANADVAVGTVETVREISEPMSLEIDDELVSLAELTVRKEIPRERLLKAMLFTARSSLVLALVRGDHEVSVEKLGRIVGDPVQGTTSPERIEQLGIPIGFISPIDLPDDIRSRISIVVDEVVTQSPNLVAGANVPGQYVRGVNFGRDFDAEQIADIIRVPEGARCRHCDQGILQRERAIELGKILRLGDYYSRRMALRVTGEQDTTHYVHMGSYGLGITRLMGAVVEIHHDDSGIIWPSVIAPFPAFLMSIGSSLQVREFVMHVYRTLGERILLDDRHTSISWKMKDADLLGIPLRLVVSRQSLDDHRVEVRDRRTGSVERVNLEELKERVCSI